MGLLEDKIKEVLEKHEIHNKDLARELELGVYKILGDNCPEGGCYAQI